MKKKKSILKILVKDGFGFNLRDTSDTLGQFIMMFFSAFLGGVVSISLFKNQTNILIWLLLLTLIFSIILTILQTIKSVKTP